MEILKSLILGIVQGLTEFIPVSSSGHLILFMHFLDVEMPGMTFEVFVHLGSLVAVIIYFRRDLVELLKSIVFFKDKEYQQNRKTCLWLLIATLVTGVFGFLFKDIFENLFQNPLLVACMIGVTGLILFFSDKIPEQKNSKLRTPNSELRTPLFIGLGQALAITPGLSRSGTTITFALLAGLDRKSAATFSFLLSIPAIIGANLSEFKSLLHLDSSLILSYLIGFFAAFISGYIVIKWLLKLVINAKLRYFSYYCWGVAVLCVILIMGGF